MIEICLEIPDYCSMKRIIFLFLSVLLPLITPLPSHSTDTPEPPVHFFTFGISAVNFGGLNKNDTTASLKAWTHAIIDEEKFNLSLQIDLFNSFDELSRKYDNHEIDAASINVGEFMQLHEKPGYVYIPSYNGSPFIQYALIVRKNNTTDIFKKLFNEGIAFHDSPKMIYAVPWLQLFLMKVLPENRKKEDISSLTQKLQPADNPSKAIFEVFFNQSVAALVTFESYKIACELNPQLQKNLDAVAVSPRLIAAMFLLRPTFQASYRKQLEEYLETMHTTAAGKQVLTTFQSEKIIKYPTSILQTTMELITMQRRIYSDEEM